MVLTLKVISCAINYNDGLLKEEGLREAQKKNRLIKLPSLIEYFGYCLCCGSHFAGPVFEMKDYLDWAEGKGVRLKKIFFQYTRVSNTCGLTIGIPIYTSFYRLLYRAGGKSVSL